MIDAALRGFFVGYQCILMHCQVKFEHKFAFLVQVGEINGDSASGLHFESFDSTPTLANSKEKGCF